MSASAPFDPRQLEPGDTLLYRPASFSWTHMAGWFFGRLIALKTWRNVSHVEIYAGNGVWPQLVRLRRSATAVITGVQAQELYRNTISGPASFASRDGLGVNVYPLRLSELAYVLRPIAGERIDMRVGLAWFTARAQGQRYDWLGLTRFVRTSVKPSQTRMFCSAFWLRFYRASNFNPFSTRVDADSIAPGEILTCPKLEVVWDDGKDVEFTDLVQLPA